MQDIHIKRYSEHDPECQGCIEPEDRSWQLLIDKEGFPHLIVRTNVEDDEGKVVHGYVSLDELLPPEMGGVKDVMLSTFGGDADPSDVEDFEFRGPCPR